MLRSDPSQNFGSTSPLFSEYTNFFAGRVLGEHRRGAAEILSRIGAEHGN